MNRQELENLAARVEGRLAGRFAEIDGTAWKNTCRVMEAFRDNRVSDACFAVS